MKRVTGVGGIFFKSDEPEKLYQWYEKHLGVVREPDGNGVAFHWRDAADPEKKASRVGPSSHANLSISIPVGLAT